MKTPLRRLAAVAMATVALAASVTGCASSDTTATDILTVGFVVDPSWAQIPVAVDTGLFTKHGVTVKVVNFQDIKLQKKLLQLENLLLVLDLFHLPLIMIFTVLKI